MLSFIQFLEELSKDSVTLSPAEVERYEKAVSVTKRCRWGTLTKTAPCPFLWRLSSRLSSRSEAEAQ